MTITQMSTKALKELGYDDSGSSSIPGLGMTIFSSEAEGTYRSFDQWDGFDWDTDPVNVLWLSQQEPGRFLKADCTPAELRREIFSYEHPKSVMFAEGAFFAVNAETIR